MKKILIAGLLSLGVTQASQAQDNPGLSPNICTCISDPSPLLYRLQVYNAQGYPDQIKTYGPYSFELCQQAAQIVCQ